jgi:hypothetical protein
VRCRRCSHYLKAETKRAIHKAGGLFKLLGLGKRKPPMKRRL